MSATRSRGHLLAEEVVRGFILEPPHAVVLVGPAGVGKTTLATDLAAGLLCQERGPDRPCGRCRGCRMVASENHPDLHRLSPEGPGGQVRIGDAIDPEPGTVRGLIRELALLPIEGTARVAMVEHAERLTDAAQEALLKTLEEPPSGVTIVLCAEDDAQLLPTVRSRCARLRLGLVGNRDIEALLEERGLADAPTAARLARLAGGRPGLAVAYAAAPEAADARAVVMRTLLDLLDSRPAARLRVVRELLSDAVGAVAALGRASGSIPAPPARSTPRTRSARSGQAGAAQVPDGSHPASEAGAAPTMAEPPEAADPEPAGRTPASERRRAASWLLDAWRDLCRDLLAVSLGRSGSVHDPAMLEELAAAAERVGPSALANFLGRLGGADEALEVNASPELLLDSLVLAWPTAATR
jgi:DNA polymerase III delta' subunit